MSATVASLEAISEGKREPGYPSAYTCRSRHEGRGGSNQGRFILVPCGFHVAAWKLEGKREPR